MYLIKKCLRTFWLMTALGLAACHRGDGVKSFIPGTYVKSAIGDFSSAKDTLVVAEDDHGGYQIMRHTAFVQLKDGQPLPVQYRAEYLAATYDAQRQVLTETIKGRVFTFDPARHILVVNGKGVYHKLE
ncbi:MAG: hypothetical protein V4592_08400 [Bacteroidota bacterium]